MDQFKVVRRFTRRDRGAYSAHAWLAYGARISARGATVIAASKALDAKIAEHIASATASRQHDPRLCGQCTEDEYR